MKTVYYSISDLARATVSNGQLTEVGSLPSARLLLLDMQIMLELGYKIVLTENGITQSAYNCIIE